MATERNLLFGVLAVQLRLASPRQLVTAAAIWSTAQNRAIGEILVQQGVLASRDRELIESLIARQLELTGEDAGEMLASLGGSVAVEKSFGGSLVFDKAGDSISFAPLGGTSDGGHAVAEDSGPTAAAKQLGNDEQLTSEQPGRYTLRGEQGRGGIGRVLIAYDQHIGREIALKQLLTESASSQSSGGSPVRKSASVTARFLREARITGQLEHPSIVPVYELGRNRGDGTVYYTMKLVRGETLAAKLAACRNLAERLALLPHFNDICHAIAYAHSRGVIHRDIKPANVMVGEFGETVLLDWGLAKVKGQRDEGAEKLADEVRNLKEAGAGDSVEGKPIGTPSYMPPEQADGRIDDVDERSDVWSLGAVLYEILTGKPPFSGVSAFEVIGMVLADEVEPVLQRVAEAPRELAAIAMRCLQRDPAQRYQSVEQLADDITAFQTGGLVSAYSYSSSLMFMRFARRNWPVLATAAAGLLLVIAIGLSTYAQVLAKNVQLRATNHLLDQSKRELMAFKLATESQQNFAAVRDELAALLAIEAAKYNQGSTQRQLVLDNAVRGVASAWPFSHDLLGHEAAVRRVVFSPDGNWLASSSDDRTVRLWDMRDQNNPPIVLGGYDLGISASAFSPDGKTLVTGSHDMTVRVWDLANTKAPRAVLKGHTDSVWYVAVSPNGKWIASCGYDKTIRLWSLSELSKPALVLNGHTAAVQALAFSSDSRTLFSASDDRTVRMWDVVHPGTAPRTLVTMPDGCIFLAFSRDHKYLGASGYKGGIYIWKTASLEQPPLQINPGAEAVWALSFSPDDSTLATCANDHTIKFWDVANGDLLHTVSTGPDGPWSVDYSPDGQTLAYSNSGKVVELWDLKRGHESPQRLSGHDGLVRALAITRDGKLLASGGKDGRVLLWHQSNSGFESTPTVIKGPSADPLAMISSLAFSPDGSRLVAGCWDAKIRLWDLASPQLPPHVLAGHTDRLRSVAFSPQGTLLASASDDGTIRLWNLKNLSDTPVVIRSTDSQSVLSLAFDPQGHELAAAGTNKLIQIYDVSAPGSPPRVLSGHTAEILNIAYSADGTKLASCGVDQSVRVWDLKTPRGEPLVLRGHGKDVYGVAFSPDGKRLASCAFDGTVRVWDISQPSAQCEVLFPDANNIAPVVFDPQRPLLLSGSGIGAVLVWRLEISQLVPVISKLPHRNMTYDEWRMYVGPDVPYERTIPSLPAGTGVPPGQPGRAK